MSHIEPIVKLARREVGVSKHVPVTHFNSPTVLESKSGAIFSVIKLAGTPFDTEKTDTLNQLSRTWHRALTGLDERFAVLGTLHRRKANTHLAGMFTNPLAKAIDKAYHAQFQNTSMYVNDLYLTVIYKGLTTGKVGRISQFFNRINSRYVKSSRNTTRLAHLKSLKEAVFQLATSLSDFKPQILGDDDKRLGYSELLSYLSLIVNGGEVLRFKGMQSYPSIASSYQKTKKSNLNYPQGNISQYITTKRLFFGDIIQFQGALPGDTRFGAIVTIKRYGNVTANIMLDPLLNLNAEFIATHSFAIETKSEADKTIKRHTTKMENANDPAISQINALSQARDDLASDNLAMGYHHNTVMLLNENKKVLEADVAQTIKCYADAEIVAVRETLGQEAAFWAQIPTNFNYIARSSLISSQNFVDFFPLHNYRTGFYDGNHLGSAMTLVETLSKTPLWLNLHARGPHDNPAPGHTTLIGGNGSGKTVAMCFFDAQLNRYGSRSFFFDRNRGMEIYIRACGGEYTVLSPDHAGTIQFNPFQLADTPNNRKFCKDWLVQLVRKDDEIEVDEAVVDALHQCVEYAYQALAPKHRNLTNATKILPVTFTRWLRLKRWLRGDGSRAEGDYAYLFDNVKDTLNLNQSKLSFDMTHFLDNEPPNVLAAVMMYLFHHIEESAQQGQLVSIFLDEAWQYLDNAYWQQKLCRWLPTLRKLNLHLVFATQSPKNVATSPISHTILDNCATNIYFANPQAKPEHYMDGFNLTQAEFNCIKHNEPQSRLFLYKQGHESALGKLNLSHLNDWLKVMSGTQASVARLTQIRAEVGDDPNVWLPIFLEKEQVTCNAH